MAFFMDGEPIVSYNKHLLIIAPVLWREREREREKTR